ncbi:hypothetical protein BZA70DRAFT_67915 [Myxozyma melibiosi]|uniref:Uncharacterized protein n=1 Tax=Myxozyma melibiosi TaxID=54550 RepID=A0ABR1F160_9ASCO
MFISDDIQRAMLASLLEKRDSLDDAESTVDNATDKVVSFAQCMSCPLVLPLFDLIPDSFVAFKHWDTCMANTGCKVIAIVGIVLAVFVVLSLCAWIIRIVFYGTEAACWLCSKCCGLCCTRRDPRSRAAKAPPNIYNINPQQPYYAGPPAPPGNYNNYNNNQYANKNYAKLDDDNIEMGRMGKRY